MGTSNFPLFVLLQGGDNYQVGWHYAGGTYAPSSNSNPSNIPLSGGFNPSQQGGFVMPYRNQFHMGGYTQYHVPNPNQGMYPYATNPYKGMPYSGSGMNVNPNPFTQSTQNPFAPTKLPFLATLEFPYLSKLTNDPIRHHFAWPFVPTKIPTHILKFDGKMGMTLLTISPHTIYGVSPIHFWMTLLNYGYSLVLSLETWLSGSLNY